MRERGAGAAGVTSIELFFDLVYVFAITQLSHYLLHHLTVAGRGGRGLRRRGSGRGEQKGQTAEDGGEPDELGS
jgi:hypothetical protein